MRLATLAVAYTISLSGWAQPTATPEAWKTTDLDFALVKTFFSNEKCHSNPQYLVACKAALAAAANLLKQPLEGSADYDFEKEVGAYAEHLPPEIPRQMLWGAVINGVLSTFDAHAYLRPADEPLNAAEKTYIGTGFTAMQGNKGYLVNEVYRRSPAEAAGLAIGDWLTAIGDEGQPLESVLKKSPEAVQYALHGQLGTVVQAAVTCQDGSQRVLKLTRASQRRLPVEYASFPQDPDLGYIRLRQFLSPTSCNGVREGLRLLSAQGVKKFVLDLRGNPGGSMHEALCISSLFTGVREQIGTLNLPLTIPRAEIVHVFDQSPTISWLLGYAVESQPHPLVVLMDHRSASSSEIVAGALQYYHAAWVVGRRSFGKGTAQTVGAFEEHPSLLIAATSARFYFPNLKSNQRVGITPSFNVPMIPGLKHGDLLIEREADIHPNASAAVNEAWGDERSEQIALIRECIHRGQWDQFYLHRLGYANGDYQRAFAAAVLKCDL